MNSQLDISQGIIPHNINIDKIRRDSIIHSPGVGGVSWGSRRISTWLRNESVFHATLNEAVLKNNKRKSISLNKRNSLIDINGNRVSLHDYNDTNLEFERQFCKDYSCCGLSLPNLHDLLSHYKECHINLETEGIYHNKKSQSQGESSHDQSVSFNRIPHNQYDHITIIDSISTNEIFLDMDNKQGDTSHSSLIAPLTPDSLKMDNVQLNSGLKDTIQFNNPFAKKVGYNLVEEHDGNEDEEEEEKDNDEENFEGEHNSNSNTNSNTANHEIYDDQELSLKNAINLPDLNHNLNELHLNAYNIYGFDNILGDPARNLGITNSQKDTTFKCPVIGCNKCYKNQNGLKYHKIHGHKHQKLQNNPDGTITVLDPITNQPLYHNSDFEKDKPYHCEVCGKRYKNLNGLKYHRGHTTH